MCKPRGATGDQAGLDQCSLSARPTHLSWLHLKHKTEKMWQRSLRTCNTGSSPFMSKCTINCMRVLICSSVSSMTCVSLKGTVACFRSLSSPVAHAHMHFLWGIKIVIYSKLWYNEVYTYKTYFPTSKIPGMDFVSAGHACMST